MNVKEPQGTERVTSPASSTEPEQKQTSPDQPVDICQTRWFNRDNASGDGDKEWLSVLHHENPNEICDAPIAIEAQTVGGIPASQTGQEFAVNDASVGFVCINVEQGKGQRCHDYQVRFTCPPFFCSVCKTDWFDRDNPFETGDHELLSKLLNENPGKICSNPAAMEVETLNGTPASETGQQFAVNDVSQGFSCFNADQGKGVFCLDYRVRFTCPESFCAVCKTRWFNSDHPTATGDYELLCYLREDHPGAICLNPIALEVQTVQGIPASETGQKFACNDVANGFACINAHQGKGVFCHDYKVRFTCPDFFCSVFASPPSVVNSPPPPCTMSSSQKKEQPAMLKPRPLGLKQGLAEMYQEELLCDATLIVDGQTFPCHRALLAAISPYFRNIFVSAWPDVREILLTNVAPSTVRSILKYIYTEEIILTPEQAPDIFAGASQLQIVPLRDICCRFLITNLSTQNCFAMYTLAHTHKSRPLLRVVVKCLTLNFEKVFEQRAFLQLDLSTLVALISSNDLAVASELKVYQAVRRWVSFQPSKRSPHLGELMRHVRFSLFNTKEQVELYRDLEKWGDLQLEWKNLDSQERLHQAGGLRQGMYKPHIMCVDTQMYEYQELESENASMACYEPQAEKWETLPGLQALTHACCAGGGNTIYISGGVCRNSYSSALHEFDAFKGQWVELPSMASPRCAHGFLFYNQRLFAVGGWCKFQSFLDSAESFDLKARKWAKMARLPFALSHPASCVFRKKLYFLGGATSIAWNWVFHRGFLVYEPDSDTWTQVPLSTGFFAAGAIAVDDGIYVLGGFSEKKLRDSAEGVVLPENRHSTRKCFFVNKAGKVSWGVSIPKLPRGIANAGVVYCNNRIYVLGGEDLTQRYKAVYYWEPGENHWHRCATEIPVFREGISRFGCAVLMRPKPHVLQLFQKPSRVLVAAVCK
uniref:kelch-like protein 3 n=1 Tax=Euleptes europaea TaxID=460621 RepID=UPI00253FE81C|nr:kelch-like protein 3 [Euleptes europaea]